MPRRLAVRPRSPHRTTLASGPPDLPIARCGPPYGRGPPRVRGPTRAASVMDGLAVGPDVVERVGVDDVGLGPAGGVVGEGVALRPQGVGAAVARERLVPAVAGQDDGALAAEEPVGGAVAVELVGVDGALELLDVALDLVGLAG